MTVDLYYGYKVITDSINEQVDYFVNLLYIEYMEEYRPIPGFEDYHVSNLGNVISYKRKTPRRIKPQKWNRDYRMLVIYRDGKPHWRLLHVCVMLAFVGPCPEEQCVRHLDGDPSNNVLTNLAYGTLADNQQDRIGHGTYGMKLNVRKVKVIRGLHKCGFKIKRIAEIFGINRLNVRRILRYQAWANVD